MQEDQLPPVAMQRIQICASAFARHEANTHLYPEQGPRQIILQIFVQPKCGKTELRTHLLREAWKTNFDRLAETLLEGEVVFQHGPPRALAFLSTRGTLPPPCGHVESTLWTKEMDMLM